MMTLTELKAKKRENDNAKEACRQREIVLSALTYLARMRDGAYDYELLSIGRKPIRRDDSVPVSLLEEALTSGKEKPISEAILAILKIADDLAKERNYLVAGHYRYVGRSLAMRDNAL